MSLMYSVTINGLCEFLSSVVGFEICKLCIPSVNVTISSISMCSFSLELADACSSLWMYVLNGSLNTEMKTDFDLGMSPYKKD